VKPNAAFLLSQVGAYSAEIWAGLLGPLRLSPPHSGIMWLLNESAGISQHEMASTLRMHPSRLVGLLDDLEKRRLIERRDRENDRRVYSLYLTEAGERVFDQIRELAAKHEEMICSGLSEAECRRLADFLQRIAASRNLTLGVHPGFRWLGRRIKPAR
jgi:DNA-binding MarR family transcriptional regulator